ncbi:hypothetical protein [Salinibacterium sp. ZJ454]|uniref:hypothetical protein n=1 Tax=Salinibacterium sp. ZJ454 TaxID=2708339 RepID=UPI00141F979B|nr:hypothetical protein [Salinibacterium sp. ZJ454]
MSISKKWSAAAAGLLALALASGGAVSASAAPGDPIKNPQSNGSNGSFYLFDENAESADAPGQVFDRAQYLFAASDNVDYLSEIDPDDYAAPGTWDTVYKFVAKPSELNGGTGSWRAYALDSAAGPNGGVLTPALTLGDLTAGNNGSIDSVFAADGDWLVGLAFTTNAGVTPVGMVYRTVTIDGDTDTYTYAPIEYDVPVGPEPVVEADLTAGLETTGLVTETVDSKILAIDAGVAQAGKTLSYGTFPAGLADQVILDANGVGTIDASVVPYWQTTKLYLAESDNTVVAWDTFTLSQDQITTDTTDVTVEVTNSGKFSIVAPAAQSIDLGDVRRNRVTTPVALGAVSVFDDRDELKGWNLNITSSAFTGPGATSVPANALGYAPVGTTLVGGITAGAAKLAGEGTFGVLATADAGSATGEFEPVVIDTNLTFKAPINAAKGVHTAVLTLDLVSK